MRSVDLIRCIRDAQPVDPVDLRGFIDDVAVGRVPDYQAAAFLMAVYHRGLSDDLTVAMTLAMRDSGRIIDHPSVDVAKVDKHSTGGVGDKISLALAPLVAVCGLAVPMVSGRGLGHTGGTLDKLESIPGFRVDLGIERFQQLVAQLGVCLIGQTDDIAPADRLLYGLRDATATVESIPLITASILSKKLAEGIDALVIDVKVGAGAFMKNEASAKQLAQSLVRVGSDAGLRISAMLTPMDAPLGRTIGNSLEVIEAIEILRGEGPKETTELTATLGGEMLRLGGVVNSRHEGEQAIGNAIASGTGFEKFKCLVQAQGGDPRAIDDTRRLPVASQTTVVHAQATGFITGANAYELGMAAMQLGAGRATASDTIDPAVGIEILTHLGDAVKQGQPIARVHHNSDLEKVGERIKAAFSIKNHKIKLKSRIISTILA